VPGTAADVIVDVPSGRVTARVAVGPDGSITGVTFVNVPSYLLAARVPVATSRGELVVDLAYGGAIYDTLVHDSIVGSRFLAPSRRAGAGRWSGGGRPGGRRHGLQDR